MTVQKSVPDKIDWSKFREEVGNTIFSVGFVKRTTGEFRQMTCRLGVTSHLQGGDRAYDPSEKGLLPVYDVAKQGYRSIPLENVLWIKAKGKLTVLRRISPKSLDTSNK